MDPRYRHQLNHNSNHVFVCGHNGCSRNFVRPDLLKRHMDRHAAKGFQVGGNDHKAGRESQTALSEITPPSSEHHGTAVGRGRLQIQSQNLCPQGVSQSPHSPMSITSYNAGRIMTTPSDVVNTLSMDAVSGPAQPTAHMHFMPYNDSLNTSPVSAHSQRYHGRSHHGSFQPKAVLTSHPRAVAFGTPQSQYTSSRSVISSHVPENQYSRPATQIYRETTQNLDADMVGPDQVIMSGVVPVFGEDGELNKSPYLGMPEDFMAYLFSSLPFHGPPPTFGLHNPSSKQVCNNSERSS